MGYLRQKSQGKRHAFIRARACADEAGRPWYVIYDTSDKGFHSSSLPAEEDSCEKHIAVVYPKSWKGPKDAPTSRPAPPAPEPSPEAVERSRRFLAELDALDRENPK